MMTRENRVPLSLCPPYVSHKMDSDKTWASGMRRRLRHGMGLLKLLMSHYAIFSLLRWIRVSLSAIRQQVSKWGRPWQPYEYWATLFKTSWWNFSKGTETHFRFNNQYVTRWQYSSMHECMHEGRLQYPNRTDKQVPSSLENRRCRPSQMTATHCTQHTV